jgi:outer membrane protein assembly factor BamB
MRPGPDRDHLFNDCITFATKLQKERKDESSEKIDERIAAINRLYDLAAAAADGDSQQVNYRISRARFNRDYKDEGTFEKAIALYQEILTTPKLRTVPLAMGDEDSAGGASQAAIVAEKQIGEVKRARPSAYAAFEKKAQEMLVDAGDDPTLLKSVAEQYPNSAAAAKAMTAAAVAFEAKGDYRLAAYTLRQVYSKYGEAADKPRLLEDMARTYLAMPDRTADRVDTAAARLSAIVKLGNGPDKLRVPLKLADGKVLVEAGVTVNDALKAVQNYKSEAVSAKLPDFHIPAPPNDEQRMALAEATRGWRAAGADPSKKPKYPDPFEDKRLVIPNVSALLKPPLELRQRYSRHDRVVTYSNGSIVLYPVGSANPAGQSNDLTNQPNNIAWIDEGKNLLVWANAEIALLDGADASRKWKLELKGLPKIEVVAGAGSEESMAAAPEVAPEEQQIINNGGQRMILRRRIINGRIVNQIQAMAPIQMPAAAAQPGGPEAIASVRPVDDKVLVCTSAGQLFAIRTADGTLAWHTRLASGAPISRMVASDDFAVCKVDDQATTQLVVVDTLSGQIVRRMSFPNETGNVPVNLALAPDGMLVWTQQDRLCGKDLFEPKREPNYEIVANANDGAGVPGRGPNIVQVDGQAFNPIFSGATNPDQLLISEGRIIAVTHQGTFVSLYSLETGKLLDFPQPDGRGRAEARLATVHGDGTSAVKDWGVGLHLLGSKLYVVTRQNGPVCYNLDRSGMLWGGTIDKPTTPSVQFQEPFIGQDYFVIVDRPMPKPAPGNPQNPNANANTSNMVRLHCYTRALVEPGSDRESGRIGHYPYIRDDSGINEFQGVDGGFYYLAGDQKLYFLKGARQ